MVEQPEPIIITQIEPTPSPVPESLMETPHPQAPVGQFSNLDVLNFIAQQHAAIARCNLDKRQAKQEITDRGQNVR